MGFFSLFTRLTPALGALTHSLSFWRLYWEVLRCGCSCLPASLPSPISYAFMLLGVIEPLGLGSWCIDSASFFFPDSIYTVFYDVSCVPYILTRICFVLDWFLPALSPCVLKSHFACQIGCRNHSFSSSCQLLCFSFIV